MAVLSGPETRHQRVGDCLSAHPLLCDTFLSDDVGGDREEGEGSAYSYKWLPPSSSRFQEGFGVWGDGAQTPEEELLLWLFWEHTHPIPLAPPQKPFLVSWGHQCRVKHGHKAGLWVERRLFIPIWLCPPGPDLAALHPDWGSGRNLGQKGRGRRNCQ